MDEILWTPHGESKADMDLKEGSTKNRREGQCCAYSLCTNGSGGRADKREEDSEMVSDIVTVKKLLTETTIKVLKVVLNVSVKLILQYRNMKCRGWIMQREI